MIAITALEGPGFDSWAGRDLSVWSLRPGFLQVLQFHIKTGWDPLVEACEFPT